MCGVCSRGYHLSSRACELCAGSANAYLLPVLALALVAFVLLFVYISRRVNLTKLVSAAKVRLALMDVMQVLAVDCWFSSRSLFSKSL